MTVTPQPHAPPGGLVLTINVGEYLQIGENIFVELAVVEAFIGDKIVNIAGARCKLRTVAPYDVMIERSSRMSKEARDAGK